MKKVAFLILFAVSYCLVYSFTMEYKVSKVHGLYNFVRALVDAKGTSQTLKDIYLKSDFNTKENNQILENFKAIKLDYQFKTYTSSRRDYVDIEDYLLKASAINNDISGFQSITSGLLPPKDETTFFNTLKHFEPIYNTLVWNDYEKLTVAFCDSFKVFTVANNLAPLIKQASLFYNTELDTTMTYILSFYPIPGEHGYTTSTIYGNVISLGIMPKVETKEGRYGVLAHEICHPMFRYQSKSMIVNLDKWFANQKSLSSQLAYNYLDEGLATAIGNGYASELAGNNKKSWYNDPYIDQFAHGLFPSVKSYLINNKPIDSLFVANAVQTFDKLFPKAAYDVNLRFNDLTFMMNANNDDEYRSYYFSIFDNFNIRSSNFMYPYDGNSDSLKTIHNTTLLVLNPKDKANIAKISNILKKKFPTPQNNTILYYMNKNNNLIIITFVTNSTDFLKALMKLKEINYLDKPDQFINL